MAYGIVENGILIDFLEAINSKEALEKSKKLGYNESNIIVL